SFFDFECPACVAARRGRTPQRGRLVTRPRRGGEEEVGRNASFEGSTRGLNLRAKPLVPELELVWQRQALTASLGTASVPPGEAPRSEHDEPDAETGDDDRDDDRCNVARSGELISERPRECPDHEAEHHAAKED